MYAIKAQNLWKKYKDTEAVRGLDLQVENGELFSLLGVNGAGKTTAIRMLSCLTRPTEGDGQIMGYSILRDELTVKRIIGVSPQETAVAPNLTVRENLVFMCRIQGSDKEKQNAKIKELSESLGLCDFLEKKAGKLSGGQQRRLSIAMALIGEPSVLFLDEPTLGLDVIARSELWDVIRSLKGKTTILMTTHYMEEAESLSDRIGIMKNGRLAVVGTARELTEMTHAKRFEEAFISIVKEADI